MKGTKIIYSQPELDWVRGNCTLPVSELYSQFCDKFGRTDVNAPNLQSLRKRNGWSTGRTGRFQKGNLSWNKGERMPFNANRASTQFKPGNLPHNHKPLGHERLTKDGYIMIHVDEVNKHSGYKYSYVLKHHYVWKKAHGEIPKDKCLKFIDSDRQNCDLTNLILISRATNVALMRRGYDGSPEELKPTILAVSLLQTKAKRIVQNTPAKDGGSAGNARSNCQ